MRLALMLFPSASSLAGLLTGHIARKTTSGIILMKNLPADETIMAKT